MGEELVTLWVTRKLSTHANRGANAKDIHLQYESFWLYSSMHCSCTVLHMYPTLALSVVLCVGRKSTCVKEVEKLKKNREVRRAKLAGKMAQRKEVCVCFTLLYIHLYRTVCVNLLHRTMILVILSGSFYK